PGMEMHNPLVGVWGNGLVFLLDNLIPPFFPLASWWNRNALSILPGAIVRPLAANFEPSFHWVWELPTEDWAGIGFGLSWLLILTVVASWRRRSTAEKGSRRWGIRFWVRLAPWAALLAYCSKSGMATGARLISPYYPLLLPLLMAGAGQSEIIRRRWWR